MINCSKAYLIPTADDPSTSFCREGMEIRHCPGCCVECANRCSFEEEPERCDDPDNN